MTGKYPVVNGTFGAIEHQLFAPYSIKEPGSVSYCHPVIERVVTHDGI